MSQRKLWTDLRASRDLKGAAGLLLQRLPRLCPGLQALPEKGELLRGVVHRRSDQGYEGLVEHSYTSSAEPSAPLGAAAAGWSLLPRLPDGALIDVNARKAWPVIGAGDPAELVVDEAIGDRTLAALQLRRASRVLIFPLRGLEPELRGALTLEFRVTGREGLELDEWCSLGREIGPQVDPLGPWLVDRPLHRPTTEQARALQDQHLPVVGRRMSELLPTFERMARLGDTLLLRGPTGAGKTFLVGWLHARSARAKGVLHRVSLGSFNDELLPGELFGWRKGAHSMAHADHRGHIERAQGGTLFLDEVGNLSPRGQAILLDFLDRRLWRPLGDPGREREADLRIILASCEPLEQMVQERRFRPDLYQRIAHSCLKLPGLNERRDEVGAWAAHFAREVNPTAAFEPRLLAHLEALDWSEGNLRQLQHHVRNMTSIAAQQGEDRVDMRHLRESNGLRSPTSPPSAEGSSVAAALLGAGQALLDEAKRRQRSGEPALRLAQLEVLRGAIYEAARQEGLKPELTLRLFGEEPMVRSKNHHQEIHKHLGRWAALLKELDV
jgi:DNA-binding NtrC family response regulator